MAARMKLLPSRELAAVLEAFPYHRQSLLAEADACMLRTRWRLEVAEAIHAADRMDRTWDTAEAARGVLGHRYASEVLRTLWRTGETQMPVSEALEVLYEVCAQRGVPDADVVYLPARERRYLRMFAIRLVSQDGKLRTWNMSRLLAIEERQWAKVEYPDPAGGVVGRVITGQPDVTLADPPDGVVVLDWKSTPKAPPKPKAEKADQRGDFPGDDTPGNVSYEGYFQQRTYGLLELVNRPNVNRVTLREVYPMDPDGLQVRRATVYREDLERIARELGTIAELLDRAIAAGSRSALWKPQPGRHCSHCPRPGSCPIPPEERREGGITSAAQAEEWAAQFLVADSVRTHRREALKAWHEETGHAIPVRYSKGRAELRHAEGTRSFGLHVPRDSDRGPDDPNLSAIFKEAAARRRAAA